MGYSKMNEKYGNDKVTSPQHSAIKKRRQQELWQYMLQIANLIAISIVCAIYVSNHYYGVFTPSITPTTVINYHSKSSKKFEDFKQCSVSNFLSTGLPFLESASPLPVSEFVERRDRLAQALVTEGISAFAIEPGYTFQYYANISQKDWEVWEPEERPFLMLIVPQVSSSFKITAETVFLAPAFEAERARLLNMPFTAPLTIVPWEEHWDPYATLRSFWTHTYPSSTPKLMVDEEMRDFIVRGLGREFEVVGLAGDVERVKQSKSAREIEILRAVNTGTVEAVRAMRECLVAGLTEDEVAEGLDGALRAAGLEPFFDIVLFDENASNPHGGTNGSKVLEAETFVLIDVGAHLYEYSSDICRTFFPPFYVRPETEAEYAALSPMIHEKLAVWDIVFDAQTASLAALVENNTAASVDIAARSVIDNAGYEGTFTHRVGHGIGIKAHESPYLNKGNTGTLLKKGMAFTSEPGIYLIDKFGVRHEDILLVREKGLPELLTGKRATDAWTP